MKEIISKNSDMLKIYDAKLTNPNGDPDESNRPRMDYASNTNIVTDGRIKRYIRDYALMKGYDIFVRGVEGKPVTAENRVKALQDSSEEWTLDNWIDVRLFGAIMTIKKDNRKYTGPVQFNWGYSLNEVEIITSAITSHFASNEKVNQGTMGKDYRVLYSLIALAGTINANRAEFTKMNVDDVKFLDEAMVKAIPLNQTRSKIGQTPRLYLRVEYKDKLTTLGDLREYVQLVEKKENIRDIKDCALEVSDLVNLINKNEDIINKVVIYVHDSLELLYSGEKFDISKGLKNIEIEEVK